MRRLLAFLVVLAAREVARGRTTLHSKELMRQWTLVRSHQRLEQIEPLP